MVGMTRVLFILGAELPGVLGERRMLGRGRGLWLGGEDTRVQVQSRHTHTHARAHTHARMHTTTDYIIPSSLLGLLLPPVSLLLGSLSISLSSSLC